MVTIIISSSSFFHSLYIPSPAASAVIAVSWKSVLLFVLVLMFLL
jgi:hypothetical protein